jgi:cellulose synthase/poly-beta-1,6-N-acetylglucosamine synthase-like glycosyltransferase
MADKVRYSVVIPAFNAAGHIETCLRALLDQSVPREAYEVLVVDDGSTDATAEIARRYPVRVLRQAHAGPASARNRGAREAAGELLLFTDADCAPVQRWIDEIVRPLEEDARVAGTKGTYRTRQQGVVPRMAQVEFEEKYAHLRQREYIDFVDTGSAAFRATAFWEAGGFNTAYSAASNEDTELSFGLVARGWRLVFCERAVVYHCHAESIGPYLRRKWRHGYWRALVYGSYPRKMIGDSYTPRSTQVQMGSVALAVLLAPLPGTRWFALASLGLFFAATMPFVRRAMPVGHDVAASVPPLLFLRSLALGSGLVVGGVRLRLSKRIRHQAAAQLSNVPRVDDECSSAPSSSAS